MEDTRRGGEQGKLGRKEMSMPAGRKASVVDRAVAYAALVLGSPALAGRAIVALLRSGRLVESRDVVGKDGHPFRLWSFAGPGRGAGLLHLIAIAGGHMRFVGPRALTFEQARELAPDQRWRLDIVPGVFSAHRLQQRTGIAYDTEEQLDLAHGQNQSLASPANLGLIVRSVLASALGGGGGESPDHLEMLDVTIANTTMQEALDWVFTQAKRDVSIGQGRMVCFVNPGCLNIAVGDLAYRTVLHRADLVLPDGIGIKLATRMQGLGLRENVNGTDMFPRLCERAAQDGTPIYLLGARAGVAAAAASAMVETYPGLTVAGTHHGYIAGEEEEIVAHINASGARILLVAMGVPQQELWLERMRHRLGPAVLMGVGGLFDFYSGRIPRAPLWLREIGMEWTWRLIQEPRRMWRRYIIGNPLFLYRVWRQGRVGHARSTPPGSR